MRCGSLIWLVVFKTIGSGSIAQPHKPLPILDFTFRSLDFTNGLLGNNVTSITQDSRGFIWIGSMKGLQRYDGSRFVTYSNSPVAALWTDARNNKVCFQNPEKEVSYLSLLNNKSTRLSLEDDFERQAKKYTDWNGNHWLIGKNYVTGNAKKSGTESGYAVVRAHGNKESYHASWLKDPARNITWINNTNHGLLLLDDKTGKIYSPDHNPIQHPLLTQLSGKQIIPRGIMQDSHGNLWLFTWGWTFYRFNFFSGEFHSYSTSRIIESQSRKNNQKGWVNSIMEDNHGIVWIATANAGLLRFDEQKNLFNYILQEPRNSSSIQFNYEIFHLFQDKEENIWIGTDKGISIFNPYRPAFTVLRNDEDNPASLPKSEINSMIETEKGDLLIGTWGGGISVFDKELRFKNNISFSDVYQKNLVWCFAGDNHGKIWAGCQHGYIHIIDPSNYAIETIHPPELENSTVRTMKKDKDGNIWLGLNSGKMAKWDRVQKKFITYANATNVDSLLSSPVIDFIIDKDNRMWVTTWKHFREFDPVRMEFVATYNIDQMIPGIISVNYYEAEELNDSVIIIGTDNNGLNLFNKRTKTFTQLPINENNSPYSAYALRKDRGGNIWFTTDYDIYKYNPSTGKFISGNPEKGTITSPLTTSRFYVTRGQKWFTWTFTEVLGFFPDSISQQQNARTPITITGLRVFDKPVFIDSLLYARKPVLLSHKQNFINIEFATLDFSGNRHTKYYYQLEGVDKDWVFAGQKLFANYTDLKPGEYVFRVKDENAGNAEQVTAFTLIIATPFWQTTWFKLLCVIVAAAIISFFIRWRIRSIRHEAGLKHRIADIEMMALRAQMNPHFIFNCLNAIDNLIQTNQKSKATTYLNRFAKMLRSVLESSKNNLVPFHKDFETLKLFLELEQFRCSDKFEYELKAEPELLNSDLKVPPLIVQPFVENAIHHGLVNKEEGDCKLSIDIRLEKDHIKYTIVDNGIGRKRAAILKTMNKPEHVPYGIEITKKRVELHNDNGIHESIVITDLEKDNNPAGTKVEFWLSPQ